MNKPVKEVTEFCCMTCEKQKWCDAKAIQSHLKSAHNLTIKDAEKGEGILFLDGAGFFDNTYKYTFKGGVIMHKHVRGPSPTAIRKRK